MNSLEKTLNYLTEQIKTVYQDNLLSLYLYGLSLEDIEILSQREINLLLIIKNLQIEQLDKHFEGWVKKAQKKQVRVKIFTEREFRNALDVFPIEFLDMKENRKLLLGKDLLKNLEVTSVNLRQECEFYLRSNLLKLREGYLMPKRNISDLIRYSFPSFLSVFKYILKILEKRIPREKAEIILHLSKNIAFDHNLFFKILGDLDTQDLSNYFPAYLSELEKITNQVDQLNV